MARLFLTSIDLNKNELQNARVQNLASDPGSPVNGQIYYNTTNNTVRYYNGTSFVTFTTGSGMTFGAVTAQTTYGLSSANGSGTDAARNDHTHGTPSLTAVTPSTQAFGDSAVVGTGTAPAREDHKHAMPAAPTISSLGGVANALGTPSIYADIFTNRPAFGNTGRLFVDTTNAVVYRDTGSAWVQLYAFEPTPSTQAIGDSAAAGTAITVARGDHKHAMPAFGAVTAQTTYGSSSANGSAATIARSDHTHGTVSLSVNVASTQAIGDAATNGTGTAPAKDDHKHAMPSFGAVTAQTSFGASSGNGSGTSIARNDHTHGTPVHDGSAHSAISISSLSAPTADVGWGGFKITGLATPVSSTDAATKGYVDGVATGLDVKGSVRFASSQAVTVTYSNTGGTSARGQLTAMPLTVTTVDAGTAGNFVAGDRVLLKNQATAAQNGIWVVTTIGSGANGVWDRATDFDQDAEVTSGAFVFVEEGTVNADTGWTLTTNNPITIGGASGTGLTWAQFSGAGTYIAGNGLTLTGSTFDVVGTTNRISVAADSIDISSSYVGQASITTVGTITTGTWSGSFGSVSGANLTSLTAGNLSGTIPSGVLGNSSIFIGSTSIALNRGTGALTLASITLTDGVLDNIVASGAAVAADLWSEVTTGSIAIGAGLTTGALNIAASGTGVTPITIGHTNATISLVGNTTVTGTIAATGLAGSLLSSASPLMNGSVAQGTSTIPSRQDHVHPVDTSRSPVAGSSSIVTVGTITSGTWTGTQIAVLNGGTGATTAAGAKTNLGFMTRFSQDIVGTATSEVITHNLGTKDVIVQMHDNTTPFAVVECDIEKTTTNTITLRFNTAPTSAQYRVTIIG